MEKLKIEYVGIDTIKPYENNAKQHPKEQIEQIKKSIQQFGMNDPIGIWKDEIVEGHGRLLALKELGYKEIPIIRLDHLTDEERRAYVLAHNKLTMNSDFDLSILNNELDNILNIDMEDFGFTLSDIDEIEIGGGSGALTDEKYTTKVDIPQYEIKGDEPDISELVDETKNNELINRIKNANITDEQKEFLIKAAHRHNVFNYAKIAEYYAHQDKEMQELMEESALVIIDFDDAIKNGYVHLRSEILGLEEQDYEE